MSILASYIEKKIITVIILRCKHFGVYSILEGREESYGSKIVQRFCVSYKYSGISLLCLQILHHFFEDPAVLYISNQISMCIDF